MTTIAIIGTAFRGECIEYCDPRTFAAIEDEVRAQIGGLPKPWHFVSGGAAGVDHIAVRLRMRGWGDALTLHLPAPFHVDRDFFDESRYDEKSDAGRVSNYHHQRFTEKAGTGWFHNSFAELAYVIHTGNARIFVHDGFHARNLHVGEVDVVLAATFGRGSVPADGGTAHTWANSPAPLKIHIPIGRLQRPAAQLPLF